MGKHLFLVMEFDPGQKIRDTDINSLDADFPPQPCSSLMNGPLALPGQGRDLPCIHVHDQECAKPFFIYGNVGEFVAEVLEKITVNLIEMKLKL